MGRGMQRGRKGVGGRAASRASGWPFGGVCSRCGAVPQELGRGRHDGRGDEGEIRSRWTLGASEAQGKAVVVGQVTPRVVTRGGRGRARAAAVAASGGVVDQDVHARAPAQGRQLRLEKALPAAARGGRRRADGRGQGEVKRRRLGSAEGRPAAWRGRVLACVDGEGSILAAGGGAVSLVMASGGRRWTGGLAAVQFMYAWAGRVLGRWGARGGAVGAAGFSGVDPRPVYNVGPGHSGSCGTGGRGSRRRGWCTDWSSARRGRRSGGRMGRRTEHQPVRCGSCLGLLP